MNKTDLISAIANDLNEGEDDGDWTKADVKNVLESFEKVTVASCASGDPVMLTGFVKFERKDRPQRQGRNPATGETITIKAKSVAKATPLKRFKDQVLAGPTKKSKKK